VSDADPLRALVAAFAAPVLAELRQMRAELREVREMLAGPSGDRLARLDQIILCTPAAARVRLRRDPALAALGVRDGKSLLFKPSEVRAHLARGAQRRRGAISEATRSALDLARAARAR